MTINFKVGDTVRVSQKVKEGEKERIQVFEGVVLAIDNTAKSYTVRKVSDGVGVERIWSLDTPWVAGVEIKRAAKKIRRAKLNYLRELTPKEVARIVA